ncbi:MAG: hypothetical protein VKQ33_15655, partial [Candidatus Sericytochromatia bacterium]|nr:hypothetical protein [Candidatus Sericytochromatia bacterium]
FLLGSLDLLAASLWRARQPARPEELEDEAIIHARGGGAWVRLACGRAGRKHERVVVETTLGRFVTDRERGTREDVELLTCPRAWEQALVDQLDAFVAEARDAARHEPAVWDQLPAMAFIERAYGLARLSLPQGGV